MNCLDVVGLPCNSSAAAAASWLRCGRMKRICSSCEDGGPAQCSRCSRKSRSFTSSFESGAANNVAILARFWHQWSVSLNLNVARYGMDSMSVLCTFVAKVVKLGTWSLLQCGPQLSCSVKPETWPSHQCARQCFCGVGQQLFMSLRRKLRFAHVREVFLAASERTNLWTPAQWCSRKMRSGTPAQSPCCSGTMLVAMYSPMLW